MPRGLLVDRRSFLGLIAGTAAATLGGTLRASSAASDLPAALNGSLDEWTLSFHDDFRNHAEFERHWLKVTERDGETRSVRLPQNVALTDNGLDLNLGRNPEKPDAKRPFSAGYVRTREFRQRYGYFECSMRIAREPGVNNAFWLTSVPESEGDIHFELDVAEAKFPRDIQVAARRWRPERIVLAANHRPDRKLADAFHRYGMLWSEQSFDFFFDDRPIFRIGNDFAHTPAQLLFSNAVASFAGRDDGDIDGAMTSIAEVRVFQSKRNLQQ